MRHCRAAILAGVLGLVASAIAQAQVTYSTPGSYVLTSNVAGVSITANDVVLDLAGFTVTQQGSPAYSCTIVSGTRGNSCSGALVGNPALSISGSNVTVKNGNVNAGYSTGISVIPAVNTNGNVVLQNLNVSNFKGAGIDISNAAVARLINVQSNQNGTFGVLGNTGAMLSQVTTNYNNSSGIQLNSGVLEDITSTYNKGAGIYSAGTIAKTYVEGNGAGGIFGAAVIRDSYAIGNTGDGISASSWGVVTNTVAAANSGHGFNLASGVCYWGISAASNTGTAIVGGTPLTGSTASCP